jgi:hypothetical protein
MLSLILKYEDGGDCEIFGHRLAPNSAIYY